MENSNLVNPSSITTDIIKQNLINLLSNSTTGSDDIEFVILFGDNKTEVSTSASANGINFYDLGFGFGILSLKYSEISKLSLVKGIDYIELPKIVSTTDFQSNSSSCVPEVWNNYNLSGKDVLVGFIDSGIDYTHPAFIDNLGLTRIQYIYDLSQGGIVYDKASIQKAIESPNPLEVVPVEDSSGHGTHVAGIACGGGKINKLYYGAAFESSIAMVKITSSTSIRFSRDTLIMKGIKFLLEKSKELNIPLVINISLSTNDGAHNGTSLFEQYISTVNTVENVTFVIAAGNEGASGHHFSDILKGSLNIPFNVAPSERTLNLQLYKGLLSDISIEIRNPSQINSGKIVIQPGFFSGNLGNDKYMIYFSGPTPIDINGEIIITLMKSKNNFIQGGQWELIVNLLNEAEGRVNIWMPISEGLNPSTKFLSPSIFNTLGIPATVENVISIGSYNNFTNTISSFSGRGNPYRGVIKPDLVAPGENILSAVPGGGIDSKSGTSMSTPEVTGICALLLQWGIVNKNNPFLYGDALKYYLLKGAIRDSKSELYPNINWGYGKVCAFNTLKLISGTRNINEPILQNNQCIDVIDALKSPDYVVFASRYRGFLSDITSNINYVCTIPLENNYALFYLKVDNLAKFYKEAKYILDIPPASPYSLQDISPLDSSNITAVKRNPYLNLSGLGVIVAMIDTGIDYLNEEFIYEDGTSKILEIWDQTISSSAVDSSVPFGSLYTNAQINEAIKLKKSGGNPYSIVPSKDTIGHGTKMAGIIGARGYNPEISSVAPNCKFIMIKLCPGNVGNVFNNSETANNLYGEATIIPALLYMEKFIKTSTSPIVIYFPLGTTFGAHNGISYVEKIIERLSYVKGVVVCTGTGNEGLSEGHFQGELSFPGEVKEALLEIPPNQNILPLQIWSSFADEIIIGVTSPSGQKIEALILEPALVQKFKFVFENTSLTLIYYLPNPLTGNQLTFLMFEDLKPGIWKITLKGNVIINKNFNIWLPQKLLLQEGTRFLNASPETTLTVPSTSTFCITSAYYNQIDNSLVATNGRGFNSLKKITPQITAGGIDVKTIAPNNRVTTVSGSSVSTAVVAGACALLLQWGIVNKNFPNMFCQVIQVMLIQGARQIKELLYPNINSGYGQLDLLETFSTFTRNIDNDTAYTTLARSEYIESNTDNLFFRIPYDLYSPRD